MPFGLFFDLFNLINKTLQATQDLQQTEDIVTREMYDLAQAYAKSPEPYPDFGWLYPRWAMLALILMVPCFFLDGAVARFTPQHICALGLACAERALPWWFQFAILIALFFAFWGIVFGVARKSLAQAVEDKAQGPTKPIARFLWQISAFDRVSALILGAAVVAAVGLAISGADHFLTPAGLALALDLIMVALVIGLWWWLLDHPKHNPYKQVPSLETIRNDVRRNLNMLLPVLNQSFLPPWMRNGHVRHNPYAFPPGYYPQQGRRSAGAAPRQGRGFMGRGRRRAASVPAQPTPSVPLGASTQPPGGSPASAPQSDPLPQAGPPSRPTQRRKPRIVRARGFKGSQSRSERISPNPDPPSSGEITDVDNLY